MFYFVALFAFVSQSIGGPFQTGKHNSRRDIKQ